MREMRNVGLAGTTRYSALRKAISGVSQRWFSFFIVCNVRNFVSFNPWTKDSAVNHPIPLSVSLGGMLPVFPDV